MDVRITFGIYKDQIRDIADEAALAMLADGRAVHAYRDVEPAAEIAPLAAPVAAPARRKGR